MKIDYDINTTIYLPFRINEICVDSLNEVTYTIVSGAPFIYYRQTGVSQKDLRLYGLSYGKKKENEKDI